MRRRLWYKTRFSATSIPSGLVRDELCSSVLDLVRNSSFATASLSWDFFQFSICLRMGSKFRCISSTPMEMAFCSEKCVECLARTG